MTHFFTRPFESTNTENKPIGDDYYADLSLHPTSDKSRKVLEATNIFAFPNHPPQSMFLNLYEFCVMESEQPAQQHSSSL